MDEAVAVEYSEATPKGSLTGLAALGVDQPGKVFDGETVICGEGLKNPLLQAAGVKEWGWLHYRRRDLSTEPHF